MANRLSARAIDARLKGKTFAPVADPDVSPPSQEYDGSTPGEDKEEGLSTLAFAALTLCLCAVVAGVVFALRAGGLAPQTAPAAVFVSRAEICEQGWIAGMPNGKQLECYLTRDIERLCNPQEREHLAEVFDRYARDVTAFRSAVMLAGIGAIPAISQMSAEVSAAKEAWAKQSRDPNGNAAASAQALKNFQETAAKSVKNLESTNVFKMAKEGYSRQMTSTKMVEAVRRLIERGYMTADDFGSRAKSVFDDQIQTALNTAGKVKPSCRPIT